MKLHHVAAGTNQFVERREARFVGKWRAVEVFRPVSKLVMLCPLANRDLTLTEGNKFGLGRIVRWPTSITSTESNCRRTR
jgi:hypothetical protein